MKKLFCYVITLLIVHACFSQNVAAKIAGDNAYIKYPSDYADSSKKQYPVFIFFPGKTEFGTDISKLLVHGPARFVNFGEKFEFMVNGKLEKPLVICVQTNYYYFPKQVDAIVNYILSNYRVDKKRVYALGLSAGGMNWMKYMNYKPENAAKIAGAVMVSSQPSYAQITADGSKGYKPDYFVNAGIKYWGLCGTKDSFYKDQKAFEESLNAIKPGTAIFTNFSGFGHSAKIWDIIFDPIWKSTTTGADIYSWLLAINQH